MNKKDKIKKKDIMYWSDFTNYVLGLFGLFFILVFFWYILVQPIAVQIEYKIEEKTCDVVGKSFDENYTCYVEAKDYFQDLYDNNICTCYDLNKKTMIFEVP